MFSGQLVNPRLSLHAVTQLNGFSGKYTPKSPQDMLKAHFIIGHKSTGKAPIDQIARVAISVRNDLDQNPTESPIDVFVDGIIIGRAEMERLIADSIAAAEIASFISHPGSGFRE